MAVGDSSEAEGRLSVYAHTKHNKHRDYASIIISYPRTVVPLNRTRLDKIHVHRHVCKLVMYMYEVVAKEITTRSFFK